RLDVDHYDPASCVQHDDAEDLSEAAEFHVLRLPVHRVRAEPAVMVRDEGLERDALRAQGRICRAVLRYIDAGDHGIERLARQAGDADALDLTDLRMRRRLEVCECPRD